MSSKTTEERATVNDLLAACRGGRPWDLNSKPFYFISPHARIAVIVGGVEITRTGLNVWEIKSKGVRPKENQWRMANTWYERTERGRQVSRLMQETHLYQVVSPETLYTQYLNHELKQANRITKEKGKTSATEQLKVGLTLWFSQGTTNFFKMVREDGTTWLRIAIDLDLHLWITTWADPYVKWSKVVEETESGRLRVAVQAIGDPNDDGAGCRAEICEDNPATKIPEIEGEDGAVATVATSPKRPAKDELGPKKALKALKEEPREDAAGKHVTCPTCGFPGNPESAVGCKICGGQMRNESTPVKAEETQAAPVECGGCGDPFSSKEVLDLHVCRIDKTVKVTRPVYMSPEGAKVIRRLFPGLADTPTSEAMPKFRFKNGKQAGLAGTLAIARAPLTMSETKRIKDATQEVIEGEDSGEESDDDTVTVIPPTQEDSPKCGMCNVDLTESLGLHDLARKEKNVRCDGCQDYFHREPTAVCVVLHSGNEWPIPAHCNACHDRLDKKYKDYDWDRNICDKCRDVAIENEIDAEAYDHGAGEIDIVHTFQRRVRAISLRSMSNARMLEEISQGVGNLEERMERIEATLERVADGMTKIHQALTLDDVGGNNNNNNKIVALSGDSVVLMSKAGQAKMKWVIMKEQETEGVDAHGISGIGDAGPGMGFRSEDGATQTDTAQSLEEDK